jgi:hypothetical protein
MEFAIPEAAQDGQLEAQGLELLRALDTDPHLASHYRLDAGTE